MRIALFSVLIIFLIILCGCSPQQKKSQAGEVASAVATNATSAATAAATSAAATAAVWVTDAEKFASEYPLVGSENVFVYRTAGQTAEILARGTGVVFIGFKECPWCQLYAVFLNDVARETEIKRIFYCDIREDREKNSESYRQIVDKLSGSLQYDDEGRPRVFVPDVTFVNSGTIIGRDYETSKDTLGYEIPEEYWNDERVSALKDRLAEGMKALNINCSPCNR